MSSPVTLITSGEAKHSNRSCCGTLHLSRTIKTIVNLNSMLCSANAHEESSEVHKSTGNIVAYFI